MYDLSVVLPVYNEVQTIETVLSSWQKLLDKQPLSYQFVVCEDGSSDGTSQLLRRIRKRYKLHLNQKLERRGYGGAVIDGITSANSEYILSIDSDGQCDPKDFPKFWQSRRKAKVIIGWRIKRADNSQRKVFSFLFKTVFLLLFPTSVHDPSAPFVLYKKDTVLPHLGYLRYLKEGFWWGFVGTCVKARISIKELVINHQKRLNGVTVVYQMKKVPGIAIRNLMGLFHLRMAS